MKFSSTALLALPATAFAAQYSADEYRSGNVHQELMDIKNAHWDAEIDAGLTDMGSYPSMKTWSQFIDEPVRCRNGFVTLEEGNPMQTFRCRNMDAYDFVNHTDLGLGAGRDSARPERLGSSAWGWVHRASGREFGIIGQFTGAAFVEVFSNGKMAYLGRLPAQSTGSRWREIRVLNDIAVIGSEAVGHNVQLFDMNKVVDLDPANPTTFDPQTDLLGLFSDTLPIGRTHNVVVDWDNEYAIAVGAQPRNSACASGLQYIDLSDPTNPTSPGCAPQDGYVHDAQCVTYRGPDRRYRGRNICIGYNEDSITVYDSTSKDGNPASRIVSRLVYPGATYTHQGWWTDERQEFIILNDELDEMRAAGPAASGRPVTYIIDLRDLENPVNSGTFFAADLKGVDHNNYVVDGLAYQSNYGNGMWVHDIRSIRQDPTGAGVTVHAFLDIEPQDDAVGGVVANSGTWSSFLFPSGYLLVNTIERGVWITRIASGRGSGPGAGFPIRGGQPPAPTPVCNADNCLRALRATTIPGRLAESQEMCRNLAPNAPVSSLPRFARDGCTGNTVSRVNSACDCLPSATPAP